MSSRVGTAIPAHRSTVLSSAWVGLTKSTHTALSGSTARSSMVALLREASEGTNTEDMQNSGRTDQKIGLGPTLVPPISRPSTRVPLNHRLGFVAARRRHRDAR